MNSAGDSAFSEAALWHLSSCNRIMTPEEVLGLSPAGTHDALVPGAVSVRLRVPTV
jgi:hypothetical protein